MLPEFVDERNGIIVTGQGALKTPWIRKLLPLWDIDGGTQSPLSGDFEQARL